MRAGACTLPQTLTSEAASALKHSLSLARRRGHAQVTPLHVAATLLTSRASVLRRACLKSQPHQSSHPLQCRALELCFNVALNRLPTTPGPLLHGQPSLSNALIAALKRAQAHQRRGCIEQQQQQPLLTVKVELEQLIISILDDPSVSRVMREAGFSSTSVKNNLEDSSSVSSVFQCYSSSGGIFSSPSSPCPSETLTHQRDNINFSPPGTTFWQTHFLNYSSEQYPLIVSPQKKNPITTTADLAISVKEDLKLVVEVLLRKNKRRNTVLVGDCESLTQGLVSELMGRVERGHHEVPEELKSAQFIKFQFATVSLRYMKREDVELNLSDLKRKVDSLVLGGRGAIIYSGDLKWTVEEVTGHYSPVDHLVSEMASLLSDYSNSDAKVWLMANASYQTYMRCQMKQPPLDVQWSLQAVSVPSGGLGLSLHAPSVNDSKINLSGAPYQVVETKQFSKEEDIDKLICCAECTSNFEKETDFLKSSQKKLLPCWLQLQGPNACQEDEIVEVRRKWNRLCHSIHYGRHNQYLSSSVYTNQSLNIGKSSPYPLLSTHNNSIITPDPNSISFASKPNHQFRRQRSCSSKHLETTSCLNSFNKAGGEKDRDIDITLALGNSVFCGGGEPELSERRKQQNNICKLLQENVPWQAETIPSIVQALEVGSKNGTWLLIQGNDPIGKKRLARAIAEAVFGCAELLFHMNMANSRNNGCEILARALQTHEKLVVLVEDVDSADNQFIKFLADGFATGYSSQAIFILARGDSTGFDVNHPLVLEIEMLVNTTSPATPNLDYKRKAPEWDLPNKTKNPRTEDGSSADIKVFSRRLSTTFDLNIKADENDDNKPAPGELSPISSDLTPEMVVNDLRFPHGFLESIQNRFVFDRHPGCETQITEVFLAKIRGCFEEVYGGEYMGFFSVDRTVLEEMFVNSASFLNSCFDEWVKQVLQTSFQTVKIGGKEGMGVIMLCVGRKCDRFLEDGFIGSNLPKKIQVSFVDS